MSGAEDITSPQSPGAADRAAERAAESPPPVVSHVTQIDSGQWGARATCACRGWGAEFFVGRRTADGEVVYSESKAIDLATNAAFFHREANR
jgi:hypothetical protein